MARTAYPKPQNSLPPDNVGPGRMPRLLMEIRWFISLGLCLGLLAILLTYSKADPAWSHASFETPSNLGGRFGAYIADLMLYIFGISAFWWVVLFGRRVLNGWKELWSIPLPPDPNAKPDSILMRWLGFAITLISSMGLESIRLHSLSWQLPRPPGGILGELIGDPLQMAMGFTGATLILLFGLFAGLSLFLHFSWLDVAEKVGRFIELSYHRIRERRQTQEDRKLGEVAAEEREEFVEEIRGRVIEAAPVQIVRAPVEIPKSSRVEREKQQPLFVDIPDSELPPLALLDPVPEAKETISADVLEFTSRLIERKLAEFNVEVKVIAAYPGPVVTRYEIDPAVGVKGSQIVNLSRDLARSLGVVSMRVVETIPGKTCMALELPNPTRQSVYLSEILTSQVYNDNHSLLTLALGKDIAGSPMVADLAKMPHCLVAGTTGAGKSVGINAMILSLLFKAKPDEVRLIMIDPKMLEMAMYDKIPHLLCPVVTDMKHAYNALNWAVIEMDRRYKLMSKFGVRNLAGFNKKILEAEEKGEKLTNPFSLTPEDPEPIYKAPVIVIVIDELADLMMVSGKKIEELIARIAQKARAAGIHLVLATQRPSVDVITGLIKANVPTRISYQVSSKIDSRTILDQQGAESLLGMGDMLYMAPGTGLPIRVHGAFVSDDEVHRVVEWLKEKGEPNYIEGILEGADESNIDVLSGGGSGEADPLYDQAVAIVLENKRASISLVQRHLRIGYNRAARLLEDMEKAGLVSKMSGSGNREILMRAPE
ncbi:DNA translocase FtsK [Polynucleobacter paneuropaeus]|uniref:DNA translocase FtsK n=1 Tax=Polynucleobacter paneuropaeus TaxID=2527775 RepID=A0A9Q7CT79_9BURK|nr:DNA translocase FtsK [Polynucleobacter paneuropaeus]MBT8519820.1 DNA translocase FtsK [Polynucleobacter paneuropaeus]MBT8521311.1 DNA translocase FtsK [Polynucleobacter paneuropaeus]MBT8523790.1 DNA translocase FtsK [Polynucleobacter paneuropaeus]MBT8524443.1 DNA translocase FtsK [Polynucleobacter paneuropaeus]MBT8526946.1 DNA translocase FtsK [Polynucleobacter paneuropaeus]